MYLFEPMELPAFFLFEPMELHRRRPPPRLARKLPAAPPPSDASTICKHVNSPPPGRRRTPPRPGGKRQHPAAPPPSDVSTARWAAPTPCRPPLLHLRGHGQAGAEGIAWVKFCINFPYNSVNTSFYSFSRNGYFFCYIGFMFN
jgi:hypothetical protein